jgi:GT2 family glycosyltransferase/peptidoglycan/xylan/chitin deacetylase (PgdA/CDA1 family)
MFLEYLTNQSRRPALLDLPAAGTPTWQPESIAALRAGTSHAAMRDALAQAPALDLSLVTYHSADDLGAFFLSLLRQTFPLRKIRLLITRHARDERETALLDEFIGKHGQAFKEILVQEQPNIGYGGGHNANFRGSRADLFLISNVDLHYFEDTIGRLVYGMMTADPGVALVEARQRPFEHPKFYHPGTLETLWCSGCCVLARSSAFRQVGGFDEALFMYGEDVDLSLKLRSAGYRLAFCPWAGVIHTPPQEPRRELMRRGAIESALLVSAKFGARDDFRRALKFAREDAARSGRPKPLRRADSPSRLREGLVTALSERRNDRSFGPNLFNGLDFEWRRPFRLTAEDLALARQRLDAHPTGPLISIVIRATRDEPIVERALRSALFQTHPSIEVIVIEDGSARLGPLVDRYRAARYDVRWVATERIGRSLAASLGIACAGGAYVMFLDDDDMLFLDHVEALHEALHDGADFVVAWSVLGMKSDPTDPLNEDRYALPPWHDQIFDPAAFSSHNCLPIQSVLFRRSDAVRVGGFDPSLDIFEDWNFFHRLLRSGNVPVVTRTTSVSFIPEGAERAARDAEHVRAYELARDTNRRWRRTGGSDHATLSLVYHRVGSRRVDPYQLFVSSSHILQHLEVAADRQRLFDGALKIEIHFDDGYQDILAAVTAAKTFGLSVTAFVPTAFACEARSYLWDRLYAALVRSTPQPRLASFLASEIGTRHSSIEDLYMVAVDRCRTSPYFSQRIRRILDDLGIHAAAEDASLTASNVTTMTEAGVHFGLHGHTHRSFGFMSDREWRDELERSWADFETIVRTPPRSFAFPYGGRADLNAALAAALQDRGVEALYSMLPHELRLGAVTVSPRWQVADLDGIAFRLQLDALIGAAFGSSEDRASSAPLMLARRVRPMALAGMPSSLARDVR